MLTLQIEGYNAYSYQEAIIKLLKLANTASTTAEENEMRKIIEAIESYNK